MVMEVLEMITTLVTTITADPILILAALLPIFLIMAIFFAIGWYQAYRKNRDRIKWAFTISVSGLYGITALALLSKIEENEDE